MQDELEVSVVWSHFTPGKNFSARASVITVENRLGKVDILPIHANLISIVYNSMTIYSVDKKPYVYTFNRGVLEVTRNVVKLYLEGKPIL